MHYTTRVWAPAPVLLQRKAQTLEAEAAACVALVSKGDYLLTGYMKITQIPYENLSIPEVYKKERRTPYFLFPSLPQTLLKGLQRSACIACPVISSSIILAPLAR